MQISFNNNKNKYPGRLIIDIDFLTNGSYTMALEIKMNLYKLNIEVIGSNDDINMVKSSTKAINFDYGYYSRSIIQLNKPSSDKSSYQLYIDISSEIISKPSSSKTSINVVVYGIRGLEINVPIEVWDKVYHIENNAKSFEADIDMGNKKITGVVKGVADSDVVNKLQLNEI